MARISRTQKVTLAVGVPLTVAAIGWGGLNAVAAVGRGTEHVSLRLPVSGGKLAVHLGDGDVRMVPGAGADASLTGTVRYSLFRPGISTTNTGGRVSIGVDCSSPVGWCGADMTLTAPADVTSADLSTDSGNVSVSGPQSASTLALSSSMGDVSATGVTASDVTAHSDMGDITLTFTKPPRLLTVSDSMGDISIVLPRGYRYQINANSAMGTRNVGIQSADSAPYSVSATTSMGDVNITYGP
jgi:hypothetical protein